MLLKMRFYQCLGFPGGSGGKEPSCKCRKQDLPESIAGSGRSPGEGHSNPLQCSCLSNPMDRGAWWVVVHGSQRVEHKLKWLSMQAHTHIVFRCKRGALHLKKIYKKCHRVLIKNKQEYSPQGCKRIRLDWATDKHTWGVSKWQWQPGWEPTEITVPGSFARHSDSVVISMTWELSLRKLFRRW